MRAIDITRAQVKSRGFAGDRRWMVVDATGKFITQRSHPVLATVTATPEGEGLRLAAGGDDVFAPQPRGDARRDVVVWDAMVSAALAPEARDFLTRLVGEEAQLVFMDEEGLRLKESVWTASPVPVSFADAFPVLVTTTGSLAALNADIEAHGGASVTMGRFRPNLVIDCDEPWAEDRWTRLEIGDVVLDLVKPSDRCIVTTTDQQTGARMGKEPLASLARIHRSTDPRINGVIFGQNAVPRSLGNISVGDAVIASD